MKTSALRQSFWGAKGILQGTICVAFVCLGPWLASCDGEFQERSLDRADLYLRQDQERRGKVGTLRGLEVVHRAHRVAEHIAQAPSAECALSVPGHGPFFYALDLEVERVHHGIEIMRWSEERRLRRDDAGHLELSMKARFSTELGLQGTLERHWRLIAEELFMIEASTAVYQRPARKSERQYVLGQSMGAFQVLVDSVEPGWRPVTGTESKQWRPAANGGAPSLRCGERQADEEDWLALFETRAQLIDARLDVEDADERSAAGRSRRVEASWKLRGGGDLKVSASDRIEARAIESIKRPEHATIYAQRDRSLHRIGSLLRDLINDDLAESRTWPPVDKPESVNQDAKTSH